MSQTSSNSLDLSTSNSLSHIYQLNKFIDEIKLKENFYNLVKKLISLDDLPYNPYPGFIQRVRSLAESFYMLEFKKRSLLQLANQFSSSSHLPFLFNSKFNKDVYGLESIVSLVNAQRLYAFDWLITNQTPRLHSLHSFSGYSVEAVCLLTGEAVFYGSLYQTPSSLDLKIEFFIQGEDLNEARRLFIRCLMDDIFTIDSEGYHICLGVKVPGQSTDRPVWNLDNIQDHQERFYSAIEEILSLNLCITAEFLWQIDPDVKSYKTGKKLYGFNFVGNETDDIDLNRVCSEIPLLALHEGVFCKSSHAEAYMSFYMSRIEILSRGDKDDLSKTHEKSRKNSLNVNKSKVPFYKRILKANTDKIKTDGFKFSDEPVFSPNVWQITSPIKGKWQKFIVQNKNNIFKVIHHIILLILIERESFEEEIFVEVYKLLHSTAARLHSLMNINNALRTLVLNSSSSGITEVFNTLFVSYYQGFTSLFDTNVNECSNDLLAFKDIFFYKLNRVLDEERSGPSLDEQTISVLYELQICSKLFLLQLSEDILLTCPLINQLIERLCETFPECVPQVIVKNKIIPASISENSKFKVGMSFKTENERGLVLDYKSQVVNAVSNSENSTGPKTIARDSVLLKYLIDCRLDELWQGYLVDLLTDSHIPRNPYPQLVSALRRQSMRMDLCFESDEKCSKRILQQSIQPIDPATNIHLCQLSGSDASGLSPALCLLDVSFYNKIKEIAQKLVNSTFVRRRGPYKVAICTALSGHCPLFGRFDPYLLKVEMEEHCYIQGPRGCSGEALQLYSSIVHNHLMKLGENLDFPLIGLSMGASESEEVWDLERLKTSKKAYASEFERHSREKQKIWLKTYVRMDWRYICTTKVYQMHYIEEESPGHTRFFTEVYPSLFQNVFFSAEKAAFHLQYNIDDSLDLNTNLREAVAQIDRLVLESSRSHDWLTVHRYLLTRSLITQGKAILPETWRILHSYAAIFEYLEELVRSIKDLIQYCTLHRVTYSDHTAENKKPRKNAPKAKQEPSSIDPQLLSLMGTALIEKLENYGKPPIGSRIQRELLDTAYQCMEKGFDGFFYPILSGDTVKWLNQLEIMLSTLKCVLSNDVHQICENTAYEKYRSRIFTPTLIMTPLNHRARPLPLTPD